MSFTWNFQLYLIKASYMFSDCLYVELEFLLNFNLCHVLYLAGFGICMNTYSYSETNV